MSYISKSAIINAPAEKIFTLLTDPTLQNKMNPDFTVLTYTPSAIGGYDNTWNYKVAGMNFSGESKIAAYEPPSRLVFDTTGGIPSHWEWTLQPQGTSTNVSLSLDYTMPGSLFGEFFNKLLIERQNEKVVERQIKNLKRMSESS